MKRLRIMVADDHALIRRGAREVLRSRKGWSVVGEAANGREAIQMAIELKPDVAVVDIGMPELDGVEVTRQIRQKSPDTKVLVLSMHESDHVIRRALGAGARGYLLKSDFTDSLTEAVLAVAEGKLFLAPKVSEIVLEGFLEVKGQDQPRDGAASRPTPREIEIIRLLAEGKTNKEIATHLGIAVRTVETHRSKIMFKLGMHSLAELIRYAMRQGWASA